MPVRMALNLVLNSTPITLSNMNAYFAPKKAPVATPKIRKAPM